jgi:hypothetical protein
MLRVETRALHGLPSVHSALWASLRVVVGGTHLACAAPRSRSRCSACLKQHTRPASKVEEEHAGRASRCLWNPSLAAAIDVAFQAAGVACRQRRSCLCIRDPSSMSWELLCPPGSQQRRFDRVRTIATLASACAASSCLLRLIWELSLLRGQKRMPISMRRLR